MNRHLQEFVSSILVAKGYPEECSSDLAGTMIEVCRALGVIQNHVVASFERNATIYRMRSAGVLSSVVARELGISQREVFRMYAKHLKAKRHCLRIYLEVKK